LHPDQRRLFADAALPAQLPHGVLWQGVGSWHGMGAAAPFIFGAATELLAALLLGVTLQEAR